MTMLQQGEQVPHFAVSDVTGRRAAYADVWQRKHLVLVRLTDPGASPSSPLASGLSSVDDDDVRLVVTTDPVAGIPGSGVAIADRWGETAYVAHGTQDADLPAAGEILDWVRYVRQQCPECEGEAR